AIFVILLAAFLVIPNAFSQETQSGYSDAITFHTDPSIVQSYIDFIAQQQAAPPSTSSSGTGGQVVTGGGQVVVSGGADYSGYGTSSGFVKCAENALRNSNPSLGRDIDQVISSKASGKVDACLLCGLIQTESGFKTDRTSSANCRGLTQLSKGVYEACGLDGTSVFSVEQNIDCGARYLSRKIMEFGGDVSLGLAAYNCGSGCVRSRLASHGNSFEAIKASLPSETQRYVPQVLANARRFKQNGLC
ncbi:MAG: lytic transglycosylase domain-containing protein, partial [Candidatus Micrarchaeota archaeon]